MPLTAEQVIRVKLREAERRNRKLRLRKPARFTEPRALERQLQAILVGIIDRTASAIRRNIVLQLPSLVAEQDMLNRLSKPQRADVTLTEKVVALFLATRAQLGVEITEEQALQLLGNQAMQINIFNREQVGRVMRSVLGVDIIAGEPFLQEELSRFVRTNVRLIRNVQEEFLVDAERIVLSGFRRGLRAEEIGQQILGAVKDKEGFKSRFRKASTRAKLIGRDQVNKLNGRLNQLRQENAGIESYIWRTSLDERVRPAHRAREGKKFSWDKPPVDGHPGEPIQCRCSAEPVFDDLLE